MAQDVKTAGITSALSGNAVERVVRVEPNGSVDLGDLSFDSAKVDIINGDVILTNPASNGKIIFPGLALFMFNPSEAPNITIGGKTITPDMFLAKVGIVGAATQEQFLSFSTLNISDEENVTASQETKELKEIIEELQTQLEEAEKEAEQAALIKGEGEMAMQMALMSNPEQNVDVAEERPEIEEQAKPRQIVNEGVPARDFSDFTSFDSSSSSASQQSSALFDTPPTENSTAGFFGFKTFLLQPASSEGTEMLSSVSTRAIYGGGGSEDSIFNPSNASQISGEIIDYSIATENLVIYADNPSIYSPTLSARIIEITANLPEGFEVSGGLIEGLPTGFYIEGATALGGGSFQVDPDDFILNDRGDIQMVLVYPVPGTNTFDMTIKFTATFDPTSGFPTPTVTSQENTVTHPVELKDVSTAADLNYINGDGEEVWVLSNQPNNNTILSGSGNDIIHGGLTIDTINAGSGDDVIHGSAGNDVIQGGAGSDTVDYSYVTDAISINLATLVNGYAAATIGATKTDQLAGIENIAAGSGNDTLIGNDGDNYFIGGDGDDTFSGGLGADTFDGGNGNDSISFINGATIGLTINMNTALVGTTLNVGTGAKTLISIENIVTTDFNDIITDGSGNNILSGAGGDDTFVAGGGINTFDGGYNGTDTSAFDFITYWQSTSGITVNLSGAADGAGFYTVNAGGWATDRIRGFENIEGSAFADNITGDSQNNSLFGGAGNDIINAMGGNDGVYGGTGSDTMDGGTGSNRLYFSDLTVGGVVITLTTPNSGTATNNGDTDTFTNFTSYTLSNQADTIYTSSGADNVSSGSGNDLFYGSVGNDTLNGGSGTDTINYSLLAAGGTASITLTTTGSTIATVVLGGTASGTQSLDAFEVFVGSAGNDTFINGNANQTIDGGAGSNSLSYAATTAAITINMGIVDANGYYTVSIVGGETDLVKNMSTIIGGSGQDAFTGNASANIFYGGDQYDTFFASRGGDTYYGGTGGNRLQYSGVLGLNSINANLTTNTVSLTFSDTTTSTDTVYEVQQLITTVGNDTVIGSALDDTIYEVLGNNTLNGGAGNNTISYRFISGTAGVTVNLLSGTADNDNNGSNNDTLSNFIHIEGSDYFDTLRGDNGNNIITGRNGNDTIFGGLGNDTLNGDADNDIIAGEGGNNTIDGGAGLDTVTYAGATSGVTGTLLGATAGTTSTITANGYGGVDTLVNVEALIGSIYNDDISTGGNGTYVSISTGSGNDTIRSNNNAASAVINGGSDTDTWIYAGTTTNLLATLENGNGTITRATFNDNVTSIEKYTFGGGNDNISIDTYTTKTILGANTASFDGGAGTDTIRIFTGTGSNMTVNDIDGDTLAGIFRNVEIFDFRAGDITGADKFDINSSQIQTINASGKTLTFLIDGSNITFADFNITGTFTQTVNTATTQTYSFTDNPGVTLTVQTA